MGLSLVRAISERADVVLQGGYEPAGADQLGADLGRLAGLDPNHALVSNDLEELLSRCDVLIDFTRPGGFASALAACVASKTAFVSGTTGLSDENFAALEQAGKTVPALHAMNFSLGVAVLRKLARDAAAMLGDGADIEIIEAHHRHKVDAPSGTALAVGESVAEGLGKKLDDIATWTRHGESGPRERGSVGFSVIRGGDIVGEHTALFAMAGERVEIIHRATDRAIFARGAVRAAGWIATRTPNLYTINDVFA